MINSSARLRIAFIIPTHMFNSALDQAVINNKLIRSPLLGVKLPKVVKSEITILDPSEQTSLQEAAGLKEINFHALRHTFATRALEAGMDVKVLSSILGHAQASTTLNLYAHALPDHKRISMAKISDYYNASSDTNAKEEISA